jgi:hypothetical protein
MRGVSGTVMPAMTCVGSWDCAIAAIVGGWLVGWLVDYE